MTPHRSTLTVACVLATALAANLWIASKLICDIDGVTYATLTDDMMISMRYARNLAEGNGLVWNPGERAVEGFTNLLWTLWMAVGHLLPLAESKVSLWVFGSSAICLTASAWLSGRVARALLPESGIAQLGAVALCAFYFPLMRWSMFGFEVGLLSVLQTAAVLLTIALGNKDDPNSKRYEWYLGCTLSVAFLTRPDTLSFSCVLLLIGLAGSSGAARRARALRLLAPIALTILAVAAFRMAYYRGFVPNTVILKMTGVTREAKLARGWDSIHTTLTSHYAILVIPVLVALTAATVKSRARLTVAAVVVGELTYTYLMGGDTWEAPQFANRPLAACAPSLVALVAVGTAQIGEQLRQSARWVVPVSYAFMIYALSQQQATEFAKFDYCSSGLFNKVRLGLYVRDRVDPGTRIGAVWAGAFPYFARLPAVDILGKSDDFVASLPARSDKPGHNKWDYSYSVGKLKPLVLDEVFGGVPADLTLVKSLGYRQGYLGAWYHESLADIAAGPDELKQ